MLKDNQIINTYSLFIIVNSIFAFTCEIPNFKIISFTTIITTFISLQRMLKDDYENGITEQILLHKNIYFEIFKFILFHWVKNGIALSIIGTLILAITELDYKLLLIDFFSLLHSTLIVTFLGSMGESATISEKTNTKAIIISFPLIIPSLILNILIVDGMINFQSLIVSGLITTLSIFSGTFISGLNLKIAIKYS